MVDVGDLVAETHNLSLQGRRLSRRAVVQNSIPHFPGQVQALSFLFQNLHDTDALFRVSEAPGMHRIKRRFPGMAERRVSEIVAERNKMAVKQVQRYIRLNELVPDLMKLMDEKKLGFTTAVELSYVSKKNQNYIAVAIDSQQSSPSQAQAKRMRELDEKKLLNGDVIDGIMMEDKKEVDKVILTGAELSKYFGKETTPREMKDQIIKLLDDWKGQQKEHEKPEKKTEQEK